MSRKPLYRKVKKPYKGKTSYYVVRNLPNGKRDYVESLGYVTSDEADMRVAEYNAGITKKKTDENITLEEAYQDFTEYYETQVGTEVHRRTFELYLFNTTKIIKHMGKILLRDLRKKDIEKFKVTLKKEYDLANNTVNKHLTDLKKILEYMEEELDWFESPKIKRMPISGTVKHTPVFQKSELDRLIEGAKDFAFFLKKDLYTYLNLMKYTTMRAEEAPRLKWDEHVNFDEEWIYISSEDLNKPGGYIPMVESLKKILLEAYKKKTDDYVVPYRNSAAARASIKRLIFYMRDPVEKTLFSQIPEIDDTESEDIWERLVKRNLLHPTGRIRWVFSRLNEKTLDLGLPMKYNHIRSDIFRLLRPYLGIIVTPKMFRTSTASILSDEGVDMATVAALCRHRNIQTTHQHYIKKQMKGIQKAIEGKI